MIHHSLEQRLSRAAALWKWQRVVKSTALLVSSAMLIALTVAGLVLAGWATTPAFVYIAVIATAFGGGLVWIGILIHTIDRQLDRQWLAAALERDQDPLLDRFNALLELDRRPQAVSTAMYRDAIETQAAEVVTRLPDRSPFSWRPARLQVAVATLLVLFTGWFYAHLQPLRLLADQTPSDESSVELDPRLAIPEIPLNNPATPLAGDVPGEPWGEIRISRPGRDLRVTRHEEIPLLIEAAADRPLVDVFWSTAINLGRETPHALPDFDDPRYAVFQPVLLPEELGLSEWDIVSYHAVAVAGGQARYKSATYFVEIIPARDQLDALPVRAYQKLERLTALIDQQQEVIRHTNRFSDAGDPEQSQRMRALGGEEHRIAAAAEHFQVALENLLGRQQLDSFAAAMDAARSVLRDAETALGECDFATAIDPERQALLRLAEARRELAGLIEKHPAAFEESPLAALENATAADSRPTNHDVSNPLEKLLRETRETADAAAQLATLAAEQRQLADDSRVEELEDLSPLAATQLDLGQRLNELRRTHAAAFRDLAQLSEQAARTVGRAAEQLAQASPAADLATRQAAEHLQRLTQAMGRRQIAYELAQANALEKRLAANLEAYRQIESRPEQVEPAQLENTTERTRELVNELQQLADRDSATENRSTAGGRNRDDTPAPDPSDATAPAGLPAKLTELAKHLSPEVANQIRQQSQDIRREGTAAERSGIAQSIRESLENLANSLAKDIAEQDFDLNQQQLADQLERMQARTEGLQDAREFVQRAISEQRAIQLGAFTDIRRKQSYESLAEQQAALEAEFEQFREQHPTGFDQATTQCKATISAMRQSAQSLRSRAAEASQVADYAAQQLQQLDDALEQQQRQNDIADSQQLSPMIDRMNNQLNALATDPGRISPPQQATTAGQCQAIGKRGSQLTGQAPGSSAAREGGGSGKSGPPDPPAPSSSPGSTPGGNETADPLAAASDRLAAAQSDRETSQAARDLQQQLEGLAAEIAELLPGGPTGRGSQVSTQQLRGGQPGRESLAAGPNQDPTAEEALRASGGEAIQRGLSQLENAARRSEQGTISTEALEALRRGGVADVIAGLSSQYGVDQRSQVVVRQLREQIAEDKLPVDMKTLERLREQIQALQQDLATQVDTTLESSPTRHVDPASFPPEYRQSIETYYRSLSEEP